MSQLYILLKVIFITILAERGGRNSKFHFFKNRKKATVSTNTHCEKERMKITLILFVHLILSSKWSLKRLFLTKKGVKIINFKKSKIVPRDILEIHVVSEFSPIPLLGIKPSLKFTIHHTQ